MLVCAKDGGSAQYILNRIDPAHKHKRTRSFFCTVILHFSALPGHKACLCALFRLFDRAKSSEHYEIIVNNMRCRCKVRTSGLCCVLLQQGRPLNVNSIRLGDSLPFTARNDPKRGSHFGTCVLGSRSHLPRASQISQSTLNPANSIHPRFPTIQ